MRIGVDVMGGDNAPDAILKGAIAALDHIERQACWLFGDADQLRGWVDRLAPGLSYGLNKAPVALTSSWQSHTIDFSTKGFTSKVFDGRLYFWFASDARPGDSPRDRAAARQESGPAAPLVRHVPAVPATDGEDAYRNSRGQHDER